MKIKINPEQSIAFKKALKQAESVCSLRTTLPILGAALLTAEDGFLSIQTNNLDQSIILKIEAEVTEKGQVGVMVADLGRIAALGDNFRIEEVKTDAVIKVDKSTFKLPLSNVKDFPPIEAERNDWKETKMGSEELRNILACSYASSDLRDTRYVLQGVCVNLASKQGIGCDGKMLALSSYPPSATGWETIIPDVACRLMLALIGAEEVSLRVSGSQACLSAGNATFYTKLIEGTYPNFQVTLPKTDFRVKVARKALLEGINRVCVVQSDTNRVSLTFSEKEMGMTVMGKNGNAETLVELTESSPKKARDFTIAVDSQYLKEAVSAANKEVIDLGFVDSLTPLAIEAGNYAIIMPLRTT